MEQIRLQYGLIASQGASRFKPFAAENPSFKKYSPDETVLAPAFPPPALALNQHNLGRTLKAKATIGYLSGLNGESGSSS